MYGPQYGRYLVATPFSIARSLVTTSIDTRNRDVQSGFENAHAIASGKTTTSLDQIETSLWTALLALCRAIPRSCRASGEKSKSAKVAFIGAIYTLETMPDGTCEGPINKRLVATFESHAALFEWLLHEAPKRGYGCKRTLFLADGADAIYRQRTFPRPRPVSIGFTSSKSGGPPVGVCT